MPASWQAFAAYEIARLAYQAAERGTITRERKILQNPSEADRSADQNHISIKKTQTPK
jgi:hypothetical protein